MKFFFAGCIILLLALAQIARADDFECPKNVQKVLKGATSPCNGWHVSEPKMQEIMKDEEQLDLQKKLQLQQDRKSVV